MDVLAPIPRLGWVDAPSPAERLDALEAELGLRGQLWVKRDDQLHALHGGTKVRKLDYLLAAEPWASAERWVTVGAIGSGHVAATVAAGRMLGRQVDAHLFDEADSRGVLDNLAWSATGCHHLTFSRSLPRVLLRHPGLLIGKRVDGATAIPPGGTNPEGTVGTVRAGLELADQVRQGLLPEPSRIVVALGSGGTAVGLAVGLALGGLHTVVHGVDVVGRPAVTRTRLRILMRGVLRHLERSGVSLPSGFAPALPVIRRGFLGRGYGVPSPEGTVAADLLRAEGVPAEDVYTGKAFASVVEDAARGMEGDVLFWMTARADGPREGVDDSGEMHPWGAAETRGWRDRLPPTLARRVEQQGDGAGVARRRWIIGTTLGIVGVAAVAARVGGYRGYGGASGARLWRGRVLSRREAAIFAASAEALVPTVAGRAIDEGPGWWEVAANIDRYIETLPPDTIRELRAMLVLVEQGTALGGGWARLTRLDPDRRREVLLAVGARGGLFAQAFRGLRDLCLLGVWQDSRMWSRVGYGGPLVTGRTGTPQATRYDDLIAPPGVLPPGSAT